jgi:hypothetical protein
MAMQDIIALLLQLLQLYAAFAVMVIGFVIMVGGATRTGPLSAFGTSWAGSVARFLFLRPVIVLGGGIAAAVSALLFRLGQLTVWLAKAIISYVIDPVVIALGKIVRAVFFPRR